MKPKFTFVSTRFKIYYFTQIRRGCLAGMSKWTSYGKIYHPDISFIRTSARAHVYPADAFLLPDGFLPSAPMVKKCLCADGLMHPRGHKRVRVDASLSARTPPCVSADIGTSARTKAPAVHLPAPHPPPYPLARPVPTG
jgi:hypothetical protein